MDLETVSHLAGIGAFVTTLVGLAFGVGAYTHEKRAFAAKRERLEAYLRRAYDEKKPGEQGAKTLLHIVSQVHVTETEAINIAFKSDKIDILRATGEGSNLTTALLLAWKG